MFFAYDFYMPSKQNNDIVQYLFLVLQLETIQVVFITY